MSLKSPNQPMGLTHCEISGFCQLFDRGEGGTGVIKAVKQNLHKLHIIHIHLYLSKERKKTFHNIPSSIFKSNMEEYCLCPRAWELYTS